MRILLITPYFYPHKGGSQQYALELYKTIMKQNKDIQVDVLTYNTDQSKSVEEYEGFTIYRVPCVQLLKGQFAIPHYWELRKTLNKLFRENRYTFVNSHTRFFESSWWAPYVASHFHTKSILTDHCAAHPTHKTKLVTGVSYVIDKFIAPLFLQKYDYITVTNKATQDFLSSLISKESEVIYGGVDTKLFKPRTNRSKERKILGIKKRFSKNDVVVAFVGRMIYSKGPQILLEAAKKITKKYPRAYFIFGGNGSLYPELSAFQNDHIFFTGELTKEEISDLLAKSDVLVHPSLHHEGFPNVILEAGAAGCAVIATNMGGTYEIITPRTGIMVKPTVSAVSSKLELLIKNGLQRRKLGNSLHKWVADNYDWKRIAKVYQKSMQEKIRENTLLFPTMRMRSIPRH
ncbi:MAG: glycosyltransferase family 4 protein [Candidatus Levyibacteriota bacterium]